MNTQSPDNAALQAGFHPVQKGHIAAVVTHLEMNAPAEPRNAGSVPPLSIQRTDDMSPSDYLSLYLAVGEDYLWFSRLYMSEADLIAKHQDPNYEVYTVSQDGKNLALLELDFRVDGDCELALFGLHSDLIGQGAGRALMNHAIKTAWSRPISRFHVHTCTLDSAQALSFYIRSGFTPYKQEIEIAPDPRLNGKIRPDAAPQIPLIK